MDLAEHIPVGAGRGNGFRECSARGHTRSSAGSLMLMSLYMSVSVVLQQIKVRGLKELPNVVAVAEGFDPSESRRSQTAKSGIV
ncbi:hypothetical protein GCM10027562_06950 [Arthrobacter pigmenti]